MGAFAGAHLFLLSALAYVADKSAQVRPADFGIRINLISRLTHQGKLGEVVLMVKILAAATIGIANSICTSGMYGSNPAFVSDLSKSREPHTY